MYCPVSQEKHFNLDNVQSLCNCLMCRAGNGRGFLHSAVSSVAVVQSRSVGGLGGGGVRGGGCSVCILRSSGAVEISTLRSYTQIIL